jgi:Tfp pilus assembly protein PilV
VAGLTGELLADQGIGCRLARTDALRALRRERETTGSSGSSATTRLRLQPSRRRMRPAARAAAGPRIRFLPCCWHVSRSTSVCRAADWARSCCATRWSAHSVRPSRSVHACFSSMPSMRRHGASMSMGLRAIADRPAQPPDAVQGHTEGARVTRSSCLAAADRGHELSDGPAVDADAHPLTRRTRRGPRRASPATDAARPVPAPREARRDRAGRSRARSGEHAQSSSAVMTSARSIRVREGEVTGMPSTVVTSSG